MRRKLSIILIIIMTIKTILRGLRWLRVNWVSKFSIFCFYLFYPLKIMKRLMITFPFPNIYLSFGHICCCCCCCFFFFLSVPYVKQITNDAVYMIQFYIKKYLKGAISVEMLQRTMNHGRLRSCDEILCPNYTFTCFSDHP